MAVAPMRSWLDANPIIEGLEMAEWVQNLPPLYCGCAATWDSICIVGIF